MPRTKKCPDCDDIRLTESVFHPHQIGDGICNICDGTGKIDRTYHEIGNALLPPHNDKHPGYVRCWQCDGKGECQTCNGKGMIADHDRSAEEDINPTLETDVVSGEEPNKQFLNSDTLEWDIEDPYADQIVEELDDQGDEDEEEEGDEDDEDHEDHEDHEEQLVIEAPNFKSQPRAIAPNCEAQDIVDPDLVNIGRSIAGSRAGKIATGIVALGLLDYLTSSDEHPGVVTQGINEFTDRIIKFGLVLAVLVIILIIVIWMY